MSQFHSSVSRRDFMKAALGVSGTAISAAGLGTWAYKEGSSPYACAGWENRQGMEYFDRTPFEVDEVPESSWKVIGTNTDDKKSPDGIDRADMRWFYENRFRSVSYAKAVMQNHFYSPDLEPLDSIPTQWPSNGVSGLDPFWQDYYERYPMMLERDREYKHEWLPGMIQNWTNTQKARADFAAGDGYLALVEDKAWGVPKYDEPTQPPEVSDWAGVSPTRAVFNSPEDAAKFIKKLAHEQGATLVGITRLNPAWVVYSHHSLPYSTTMGNPPLAQTRGFASDVPIQIPQWWEFAICVSGTMNYDTLYADPSYGTSNGGYWWAKDVSAKLAACIKAMGYPARAHWPPMAYDLIVPPIAAECGYGEVGRTSNVILPDFGGNARPAIITTSLPMAVDKPINFNLSDFCKRCKLCAEVCPTGAISFADDPDFEIRGLKRFYTNHLKCRDAWCLDGGPAGCRACVAVCPWTKKNTWLHRAVRGVLSRDTTGISQNFAVWAEKNLYPKNMGPSLFTPFKGVYDPPEWLVTDQVISGFTKTPMGDK